MAGVRLEQITKQWAGSHGIKNIDLHIPDGEFWVFIGPSGCGKTTILRLIAGLETATSGQLYIADRKVNDVPARQRDVAMVFQNYALYPHMTVAENLSFGLKMRQVNTVLQKEQIQKVAKSLGIETLLNRKPNQLSGGQQQRVALGRAIVRNPEVFLLDEPLSNLDAQLRDSTRAELKLLHRQLKTTMIYVTHDQTEAMTLADRIVVLNQGEIQQIDSPDNIYQNPATTMVATFLGTPPMNILEATYSGNSLVMGSQTISLHESWHYALSPYHPGQPLLVGIRPEHLHLAPEHPHDACFTIVVVLEELLGAEKLIHAHLDGFPQIPLLIKARTQSLTDRVFFSLDRVKLFDPSNGKALKI